MINTSIIYTFAGLIRFVFVIYTSIRTVELLSIADYAIFGLINVVALLFGLFWFVNIDSSFQKLYSKNLIRKSVNFVISAISFCLTVVITIITILLAIIMHYANYKIEFLNSVKLDYLLYYFYVHSLNTYVLSLLNAKQMKIEYVLQITLPAVFVAAYLFISEEINLANLLLLHSLSIVVPMVLILFHNLDFFQKRNYSMKRHMYIAKYVVSYTYKSIPTISTKYILDFIIRSIILERFGYVELATYNFCQNLLNIFRSLEQSISRAVTPFILAQKRGSVSELNFAKILIIAQTIIAVITVLSSYIWLPLIQELIQNKPGEIFNPEMLILLGTILVVGYWKNYSLMYLKKFATTMQIFYNQTTFVNIALMIVFAFFMVDLYTLLIIQIIILFLHNIILRDIVKRRRNMVIG